MPKMIATDKHPKAMPGQEIHVASGLVRFHKVKGWATPADEVKAAQERDNLDALRAEYEKASGKAADARWKTETLQRKISEAKQEYRRRDMRAED